MEDLFAQVPENLFSVLASPNRRIYFRALMVLRTCYQEELELRRSDLATRLMAQLEGDLLVLQAEGEEAVPEAEDLPARAHAVVRRLVETGWVVAVMDDSSLEELLLVPRYASVLLEALHAICEPEEKKYGAYAYTVYSALRTADEERDESMYQALRTAYDATLALRESLRQLLHNIYVFYQHLQAITQLREVLAEHFDEYQDKVAQPIYHPLKTVDSVYRYRPRILDILRAWASQGEILERLVQLRRAHDPSVGEAQAREEVLSQIHFVADSFAGLDHILAEIDRRNASYSRAATERLQYLLNTDRTVKGKLIELLKALPPIGRGEGSPLLRAMADLPVYAVQYVDEEALYREPTPRRRGVPQRLRRPAPEAASDEAERLILRTHELFLPERIAAFILSQMGDEERVRSDALAISGIDDFLRLVLAVIRAEEPDMPFTVTWDPEGRSVWVGGWRIPLLEFVKVGEADGRLLGVRALAGSR